MPVDPLSLVIQPKDSGFHRAEAHDIRVEPLYTFLNWQSSKCPTEWFGLKVREKTREKKKQKKQRMTRTEIWHKVIWNFQVSDYIIFYSIIEYSHCNLQVFLLLLEKQIYHLTSCFILFCGSFGWCSYHYVKLLQMKINVVVAVVISTIIIINIIVTTFNF